jgi:hypothetical protein
MTELNDNAPGWASAAVESMTADDWLRVLTLMASAAKALEHRAMAKKFARQFGHCPEEKFLALVEHVRGPFSDKDGNVNVDARSFAAFALEAREASR